MKQVEHSDAFDSEQEREETAQKEQTSSQGTLRKRDFGPEACETLVLSHASDTCSTIDEKRTLHPDRCVRV